MFISVVDKFMWYTQKFHDLNCWTPRLAWYLVTLECPVLRKVGSHLPSPMETVHAICCTLLISYLHVVLAVVKELVIVGCRDARTNWANELQDTVVRTTVSYIVR